MEDPPTRILIIDTAWLGDVVFTTSLIGAVRLRWPSAEIDVLTAPRGEPILHGHPDVRRLWIIEKRGKHRNLSGLQSIARELRRERFDVVLNAHPSFRSRLLTALVAAPIRVGYEGFGSRWCFTHRVQNDLAVEPDHVERRLDLLRALGGSVVAAPLKAAVPETERSWAKQHLQRCVGDRPLLALVPGSAWETKRWPVENFAALTARWIGEMDGAVMALGGESECASIARLWQLDEKRVLPVVGEPIPRVMALLSHCEVVVGNDTGVSFLAIACGAQRVMVLYGCTQVNYAFPEPHRAITAGVPCCLPRTGHGARRCRWSREPWCMAQIAVERVWEEILPIPGTSDSGQVARR